MFFNDLMLQLQQLQSKLDDNNYKEIKQSLIELQQQIATNPQISATERKQLLDFTSTVFEQVKAVQQARHQEFELEASENFELLKEKVVVAIDFTEKNLSTPDIVWSHLLEVQQLFKGKKMIPEQREQLYSTLQKLFELVKKRREEITKDQPGRTQPRINPLEQQVEKAVRDCSYEDIEKAWDNLLQQKQAVSASTLSPAVKKALVDRIQKGFDLLKSRRGDQQHHFNQKGAENAAFLKKQLGEAEEVINSDVDFKEKWDILLSIQKEFKERKLEKETRNVLYDKLQALFHQLKTEQYKDQPEFEKQAGENVLYLSPLVEKCQDMAHNSKDFKKAKAFLIKVQADFKGRRMKTADRERLYDLLQASFTVLNNRIAEYIDSQKDTMEIDAASEISEIENRIYMVEEEISRDKEKLAMLETSYSELDQENITPHKATDLQSQIEIVKASLRKKDAELKGLLGLVSVKKG